MTLTLEEIMELRIKHSITATYGDDDDEIRHVTEFVNAIIAAHDEKLREQEQEQKPTSEFCWLIECIGAHYCDKFTCWLAFEKDSYGLTFEKKVFGLNYTRTLDTALRFSRKQDAESILEMYLGVDKCNENTVGSGWYVCEHMWIKE